MKYQSKITHGYYQGPVFKDCLTISVAEGLEERTTIRDLDRISVDNFHAIVFVVARVRRGSLHFNAALDVVGNREFDELRERRDLHK